MQDKWNMLCILFYAGQVKYVMYFMQDKWNMLCIFLAYCEYSNVDMQDE